MDTRTEDQKVRGVVPVTWGGSVREVPTLKRAAARLWRARLASSLMEVGAVQVGQIEALAVAGDLALDRMVLLIREYDAGEILGTEKWIDDHVDDSEVYAAFRMLLEVAYPFVTDLRGALVEVQRLGLMVNPSRSTGLYEWAISRWGLDPDGVDARLDDTQLALLYREGQSRMLREYDDLLQLIQVGTREGMTDVYVALKRLKRKGQPARVLPDRHKRKAPTFDALWSRMDMLGRQFPDRVKTA